jgi:hypothetical protein
MEFLNLPSCLASSVLSSWVEVQDVPRLDTTYYNHTLRPRLLAALRSPEVVLPKTGRTNGFKTPTAWMKWHTQRDVKTSGCRRRIPEISATFIAAVGGSHVRAVAVHNLSEHAHTLLAMVAMNCKFVEHLCAYDCRNPRGIETLVRCWS